MANKNSPNFVRHKVFDMENHRPIFEQQQNYQNHNASQSGGFRLKFQPRESHLREQIHR
jgi:hypothetical protein